MSAHLIAAASLEDDSCRSCKALELFIQRSFERWLRVDRVVLFTVLVVLPDLAWECWLTAPDLWASGSSGE